MTRTVSVTLASSIVYVTGTVNGVPVTWTWTGSTTWEAVADRSEDDVYQVEVTATDGMGNATTQSFTLRLGLQLITDRVRSDVDRAAYLCSKRWADMTEAEQAEYAAGPKGAYGWTDYNRVGLAVQYLTGLLADYGYLADTAPKTDWQAEDIPTPEQLEQYLADVGALAAVFGLDSALPDTMDAPTYTGANQIEQLLLDVEKLINRIMPGWLYSGEIYSGEV